MPPVKISQIKPGMKGLEVEGEITFLGEIREVYTKFGPAQVADAVLKDETGSIKLNLWRSQIHSVKVGNRVKLINAFAKGYGERVELSIGKDGKIVVLQSMDEHSKVK